MRIWEERLLEEAFFKTFFSEATLLNEKLPANVSRLQIAPWGNFILKIFYIVLRYIFNSIAVL